jgi:hypothetical protein
MDKAKVSQELRELDEKLREIGTEAEDFGRDLLIRIKAARDHVHDIRDGMKEGDGPKTST